jgi:hypothetical protein
LNEAPPHAFVVWHVEQGAPNSDDPCGGLVVALKAAWWQDMHSVVLPRNTPSA